MNESIRIFQNYPDAKELLGEPIVPPKYRILNYSRLTNSFNETSANVTLPMSGPKASALLVVYAKRTHEMSDYEIDHLDIATTVRHGIKKVKDQQWTFYRTADQFSDNHPPVT